MESSPRSKETCESEPSVGGRSSSSVVPSVLKTCESTLSVRLSIRTPSHDPVINSSQVGVDAGKPALALNSSTPSPSPSLGPFACRFGLIYPKTASLGRDGRTEPSNRLSLASCHLPFHGFAGDHQMRSRSNISIRDNVQQS